MKEQKFELS